MANIFGNNPIRTRPAIFNQDLVKLPGGASPYQNYFDLVAAAGGGNGARDCIIASFNSLAAIQIEMYSETANYRDLPKTASTLESFFCVRKSFINLNNVAT